MGTRTILVTGFTKKHKVLDLIQHFSSEGDVYSVAPSLEGTDVYITYETEEGANKAVTNLNNKTYKGDTLKVLPHNQNQPSSGSASTTAGMPGYYVRQDFPKLPAFSGEGKGEVSYNLWKYELKCLIDDQAVSTSSVWQGVRRSVKGLAAEVVMHLGESATLKDLLDKFDVLFGNMKTGQQMLQELFNSSQGSKESLTAWGCRLEEMVNSVRQEGSFTADTAQEVLRSRFWTGLSSERIKEALRNSLEAGFSYQELIKKARKVEMEKDKVQTNQQAITPHDPVVGKLDEILKQLRSLDGRVQKLEKDNGQRGKNPPQNKSGQKQTKSDSKPPPGRTDFSHIKGVCHHCGDPSHIRPDCVLLHGEKHLKG
jgi:hypothetical protein